MGKTIHPLLNPDVYPSVGSDNVAKVVVDDDFIGDDVEMETYLFVFRYGGFEVEVGKVDAQKLSPRGADCGTDEEFGRGEISHWCTFVAWIVNAIATNSESSKVFVFFLRLIIAAYVALGGAFVSWNLRFGDEETCVSAGYISDSL